MSSQRKAAESRPRIARARNAKQIARQRECYRLRTVEWLTYLQIAERVGINKETVIADIRAESAVRASADAEEQAAAKAEHLDTLRSIAAKANADRDKPGTGAYAALTKCAEMIAKVQGLEAPSKIDFGPGKRVLFEVTTEGDGADKGA